MTKFDESFGPAAVISDEARIDSPELYGYSHNALAAVEREIRRRKAAEALDIHYSALITEMKRNGIKVKPQMEASNGL